MDEKLTLKEDILQRYKWGIPIDTIRLDLDASIDQIYIYIVSEGEPLKITREHMNEVTDVDLARVIKKSVCTKMYTEGVKVQSILKYLNISSRTFYKYLKSANTPLRQRGT